MDTRSTLAARPCHWGAVPAQLFCHPAFWAVLLLVLTVAGNRVSAQFPPGAQLPREGFPNQRPGIPPQLAPGMPPGHPMVRRPAGGEGQLPRLEASGTVHEATPMGLVIVSPTGQQWQLLFDRNCKLELTGKALPDVLRPGVVISFTADIEKKTGQVQDKVASLVICSVDQNHMLGVFPEGTLPPNPEGGGTEGGGAGFGAPGLGLGGPPGGFLGEQPPQNPPARGPHARRGADNGPPVERYQVCGRITSMTKTGKFTVAAPNPHFRAPIQFELAENPEITLELSGREALNFVVRGAKVSGKGVQIGPTAGRMSEISVELVEPLTFATPKHEARGSGQRTPSRQTGRLPGTPPKTDKEQNPPESVEKPPAEDHADHPKDNAEDQGGGSQPNPGGAQKAAGIDLPPLAN